MPLTTYYVTPLSVVNKSRKKQKELGTRDTKGLKSKIKIEIIIKIEAAFEIKIKTKIKRKIKQKL